MGLELPVVVGTHPDRHAWLTDCLKTIPTGRTLKIHRTGGYEIAALRTACRYYDRFLFLHDSVQITHPEFWDIIDGLDGPAWLAGWPHMYIGVHDRDQLEPVLNHYPTEVDKETAIRIEIDIAHHLRYGVVWPEVTDYTNLGSEERHGRTNLLVGNRYFVKWKATHR